MVKIEIYTTSKVRRQLERYNKLEDFLKCQKGGNSTGYLGEIGSSTVLSIDGVPGYFYLEEHETQNLAYFTANYFPLPCLANVHRKVDLKITRAGPSKNYIFSKNE